MWKDGDKVSPETPHALEQLADYFDGRIESIARELRREPSTTSFGFIPNPRFHELEGARKELLTQTTLLRAEAQAIRETLPTRGYDGTVPVTLRDPMPQSYIANQHLARS